jgi:hypothetical protein
MIIGNFFICRRNWYEFCLDFVGNEVALVVVILIPILFAGLFDPKEKQKSF